MSSSAIWASKLQNFLQLLRAPLGGKHIGQKSGGTTVTRLGGYGYSMQQGLWLISSRARKWTGSLATNIEKDGYNQVPPPGPDPPRFSFLKWVKWVLCSIVSVALPFWKQKWNKLQAIEGEAEMIIDEVEEVAEVVQKVANATDKIAEDLAKSLPENSKLEEAAKFVEHVAEATAQDAQLAINFVHKVEEMKQDVENLENMVEPFFDKIEKESKEKKENI